MLLNRTEQKMRILGIDPGVAIVGYCILDYDESTSDMSIVSSGSIQTDKQSQLPQRLVEIYKDIKELIASFKPDCASIEELFYFKNAKTIIPVAQARGVIVMALEEAEVESFGYTPMVIKQTVTGYGRADKKEVANMVKLLLNQDIPKLDDTADAIAASICHCRNCGNLVRT
ncbi:MAG: crossover junction endodeoxyribonuclease RuvC [Candidatus Gastranaerophilales bacterium]|nr:crossover junction endodeoxyribonuclease RuvC [Candidatus Gastranaerophilales bacterium]